MNIINIINENKIYNRVKKKPKKVPIFSLSLKKNPIRFEYLSKSENLLFIKLINIYLFIILFFNDIMK